MDERNRFANYIISKRRQAGLTQKELAEKLYVTNTAVSKWERGLSYPDVTLIKPICEVLNITAQEFIDASDDTATRKAKVESGYYKKISKLYHYITLGLFIIAIFVSVLCNLIIDKTMSWSLIVITSVLFAASVINLPFINRHMIINGEIWKIVKYVLPLILLFLVLLSTGVYSNIDWLITAYLGILLAYSIFILPFLMNSLKLIKTEYKKIICYVAWFVILILLLLYLCIKNNGDWFIISTLGCALFYSIVFVPQIMNNIGEYTRKHNLLFTLIIFIVVLLLLVLTVLVRFY